MQLHGADRDKINIKSWLTADKRFPGLEIKPVDSNLKLRGDIEEWIEELNNDNPGAAFIYMQGHGLPEYMGSYVTGDSFAAGQGPSVIRSEEWINMFSKFDRHTQFIVRPSSIIQTTHFNIFSDNHRLLSLWQFFPPPVQVRT